MGAVDFFLKIDDIKGESSDSKHKDEIDVYSWSWGATQTGSSAHGGGAGTGKVSMNDFHFTMKANNASSPLFLACANGQHFKKADLTCRKAGKGQQEYLKIKLSDVIVSSYQVGGSSHSDELPVDQISLNFSKIEFGYAKQKPDGSLDGMTWKWYDQKKNEFG